MIKPGDPACQNLEMQKIFPSQQAGKDDFDHQYIKRENTDIKSVDHNRISNQDSSCGNDKHKDNNSVDNVVVDNCGKKHLTHRLSSFH